MIIIILVEKERKENKRKLMLHNFAKNSLLDDGAPRCPASTENLNSEVKIREFVGILP